MSTTAESQLPPGPSMPGMLQTLGLWTRPTGFLRRCRERYGVPFTLRIASLAKDEDEEEAESTGKIMGLESMPFVVIAKPPEIKDMLLASPEALHPGEGGVVLEQFVGKHSLFLYDEDVHLAKRRALMPPFHGEAMLSLAEPITEIAEREIAGWPRARQPIHAQMHRLVLKVILSTIFGLDEDPRLERLRHHLTKVLAFNNSPLSIAPILLLPAISQRTLSAIRPLGLHRFREHLAKSDELVYELIEEGRRTARSDGSVLALLLRIEHEDGTPLDPEEVRDEIMSLVVAGTETTASQLTWTFEHLARKPLVLKRLLDELDGGSNEEYLTATIQEILRVKPALPQAVPRFVKSPVEVGGRQYLPGVALFASPYLLHHDPEIYPDPYAFRPERFLEEPPGTYTWLPFGGGRRRCLGASFAVLEMKIILRAVLARYEIGPSGLTAETARSRAITITPSRGGCIALSDRPSVAVGAPAGVTAEPAAS